MTSIGSRLSLALLVLAACDLGDPSVEDRMPRPHVVRVTWDDGARDHEVGAGTMEVWASIDVWFDSFLDADSVTTETVRLESNGQVVRSTVLYDVLDKRVRIDPARALDPNLTLQVVVTDGVEAFGGPAAHAFQAEVATGASSDPPDGPFPIGWGEVQPTLLACGGGDCHGDERTTRSCSAAEPFRAALGLELDEPGALETTAIDVPAEQWRQMARIEPGRPDRSYLTYKMADFDEEVIEGFVMPLGAGAGEHFATAGFTQGGACCSPDDLPLLHPPPWATHSGLRDPYALKDRSLASSTPGVWECACQDTRGRFEQAPGPCRVAEGECANGLDDDGDGQEDCADADCHFAVECPHTTNCDPDADGVLDCADPDCAGAPACELKSECEPNEDGLLDCTTKACDGSRACDNPPDCDTDHDGKLDCSEDECRDLPACAPRPFPVATEDDCADDTDDDEDGAIDCADFDCSFSADCLTDPLEPAAPEAVGYCRARQVSDWILAGAPLGPERRICELECAGTSATPVAFAECVDSCLASDFDVTSSSCAFETICPEEEPAAGELPAGVPTVSADQSGQVRIVVEGCAATCQGGALVACADEGVGEIAEDAGPCWDVCEGQCNSFGDLGVDLAACGLGGT